MNGVPEKRDTPRSPGLSQSRWPVVEVPLLNFVVARGSDDCVNVPGPALENTTQIGGVSSRTAVRCWVGWLEGFFGERRAHGLGEEGVPLIAALANVSDDEVLRRANVDLVPNLSVVRRVVVEFACVNLEEPG